MVVFQGLPSYLVGIEERGTLEPQSPLPFLPRGCQTRGSVSAGSEPHLLLPQNA